eukprot:TRINITY_DN19431_c0_g1_i1.p1 TRINITY_DN19431_c0_g1~~TRINITY_DN19431_c0_g1_i1.p1  ORF type:complete len:579 (-),score=98.26 TRINITY_DN19431_c0_g1_i1:112-1848(-)
MESSMVVPYLAPYGYCAASPEEWVSSSQENKAQLDLSVAGHSEQGGHTVYHVQCRLEADGLVSLHWVTQRRLGHIRDSLHDVVKNEMGKSYADAFANAPFAMRGGFGGTTQRLQKWFQSLAVCVSKGLAPPALVAQLLLFLDAPAQAAHHEAAESMNVAEAVSGPADIAEKANEAELTADAEAGNDWHEYEGRSWSKERPPSPEPSDCEAMRATADEAEETSTGTTAGYASFEGSATPTFALLTPPASLSPASLERRGGGYADNNIEELMAASPGLEHSVAPAQLSDRVKAPEVVTNQVAPRTWAAFSAYPPTNPATPPEAITAFLEPFGYLVSSAEAWHLCPRQYPTGPRLSLSVDAHSKQGGRTVYHVMCKFSAPDVSLELEWCSQRTLQQLREDLHDWVKSFLGKEYPVQFEGAPFAMRTAPSGTTSRLHRWMGTLTKCIDEGVACPALVAQVLSFFDPPLPSAASMLVSHTSPSTDAGQGKRRSQSAGGRLGLSMMSPLAGIRRRRPRSESPIRSSQKADTKLDLSEEGGTSAEDDTPAMWSAEKRRAGYIKLREWFMELKRKLESTAKQLKPT